jgi:purine-binding chemotaxis protein CheW
LVDKIDNILNISSNQISHLSSGDGKNKINSIARTKKGIISIIDRSILEKLGDIFSNLIISPNKTDTQDDVKVKNMYEAIFFKLNNELFGFNVDKVLEILDMGELTTITQMPSFVIGIMNIRGDVVPIISTSSYIGIENNYIDIKDQKIIVYDYMGVKLGFCVDEIIEVMAIDNTMIEKSQNTNIFFGDIINLKNSIALMFNTENFSYLVD